MPPLSSESLNSTGTRIRREVLGNEHVDKSLKNANEIGLPLQQLATEFCWGTIWARPGLDRKTRSLLNLVMLTALNRPAELGVHILGAVNNGATQEEILEALLQTCVYCGFPAAMDAFRVARAAFEEK